MSPSRQRNSQWGVRGHACAMCVHHMYTAHTHEDGGGRERELKYKYSNVECFIYCITRNTCALFYNIYLFSFILHINLILYVLIYNYNMLR